MGASITEINVKLLREHLVEVSEHEGELTDLAYRSLFAKRPDAEELFGAYSRPNQQRMMAETLGAVLNMLDREPWLHEYVHAMGSRHQFSYETPTDMYAPYAEAVLEALAGVSGPNWTTELADTWKAALDRVNEMMTAGYLPTSH
ncbi:MAG: globin domain-containing protein [Polyangiales bacterium]